MKTKVWIVRDGGYSLYAEKPEWDKRWGWEGDYLIDGLCPTEAKKYFGLKHHVRKGQMLQGIMEFKFRQK